MSSLLSAAIDKVSADLPSAARVVSVFLILVVVLISPFRGAVTERAR